MTNEQLEAGRKLVRRADDILADIDALKRAQGIPERTEVFFHTWNTKATVLDERLLRSVIMVGMRELPKHLEAELTAMTFPYEEC